MDIKEFENCIAEKKPAENAEKEWNGRSKIFLSVPKKYTKNFLKTLYLR